MSRVVFWAGVLAVSLFCLYGCGAPVTVGQMEKAGGRRLDAPRVLALVSGNSLRLESFQQDFTVYFDPSRRAFAGDINGNRDQGRWDVSSLGELCLKLNSWWFNDLRCFTVYEARDGVRLFTANGALAYGVRQSRGDTAGLFIAAAPRRTSYRPDKGHNDKTVPKAAGGTVAVTSSTVVEKQAPAASAGGRSEELKSTVKWMAKDCPGCNLAGADLRKADLVGAQLRGARLSGANLRRANLRRADLQGADLSNAVLVYANLPGANLKDCNLRNADLTGANLILADLTGADISGAILTGAHLDSVKGLKRK